MGDEFTDHDLDTPTEADLNTAYGSQYLGTADIGDRKIRVRIAKVRKAELTGQDGRKRTRFLVYFDSLDKALVLNSTNKNFMVDKFGRVPAKWEGALAGIYVDRDVAFGGKRVGGIRLTVVPGPAKTAKPAKTKPTAKQSANEWPEESGDPGFSPDPDLNDDPNFDQAAE
jgi:hypothetical protein